MDESKNNFRLLNLACGAKVSTLGNWTNADFSSPVSDVVEMDILKGINFPNDTFDVVYTAQFVEHLTYEQAEKVLNDVNRVLKPGGVVRIVTPDLEELVHSYLKALNELKQNESSFDRDKYNWLRIELFDQIVRDQTGGEMSTFLAQCDESMKNYLTERIGYTFASIDTTESQLGIRPNMSAVMNKLKKIPSYLMRKASNLIGSRTSKIGKFRMSGEVHRYIHDVYSLSRILYAAGFSSVTQVDPYTSVIQNWQSYELDVIDGVVDGPLCLYVEAIKS